MYIIEIQMVCVRCLVVCKPVLKFLQGLQIGHDGRVLFKMDFVGY